MPLPAIGPGISVGTAGVLVAWPLTSLPGAGVQVAPLVPSLTSHIAITQLYSWPQALVGVAGLGSPIGTTRPSSRTLTILVRSPTNIHGAPENGGRCGRSASGSPEKPVAIGLVAPVVPRCSVVPTPQRRVSVAPCGSRSLRTEWHVTPPPCVAPEVWPGRTVASPSSWCQMLVSRAHPSMASRLSLRLSVPRPKRTMLVSKGASNGALVTLLERRVICSDIATLGDQDPLGFDALGADEDGADDALLRQLAADALAAEVAEVAHHAQPPRMISAAARCSS